MSDAASAIGRAPVIVLGLLLVAVGLRVFGPDIEARLLPVVVDHVVAYRIDGDELVLVTQGTKVRDCTGERRVSRFVDRNLNPATLVWQQGPNRVEGPGHFDLENRADLPPKIERPIRTHTTIFYRCHPFWLTPYRYPTADAR